METVSTGATVNLWFPVGEKLHYRVDWGVLSVGTATVSTDWIEEDGRKMVHIRSRAISNRILQKLYPVNDVVETITDSESFLPFVFVKNLREGRHRHYEVTTFDYAAGKAHWRSVLKEKEKDFEIDRNTRDLLSFLYFVRQQPLEPEKEFSYRVMADDKVYDLFVRTRKIEEVKLPLYGKVECIRVEPEAAFQGLFVRKGRMTLWVSTDKRRLMTSAVVDTPFANVKLVLLSVEGPGTDKWVSR